MITFSLRACLAVLWDAYSRPVALVMCVAAAIGLAVAVVAVGMGWVK